MQMKGGLRVKYSNQLASWCICLESPATCAVNPVVHETWSTLKFRIQFIIMMFNYTCMHRELLCRLHFKIVYCQT